MESVATLPTAPSRPIGPAQRRPNAVVPGDEGVAEGVGVLAALLGEPRPP